MEKQRSASTFEMLCDIIDKFAPCMNDYLYAYDITNDVYYISKKALDRFALPSNLFHDVVEAHNVFVYADDIKILSEDLKKMLRGEKESHNIKYRWIGKNGQPIWINCKGCIYVLGEKKETFLLGCINEIGARQAADNVSNLLGEEAFKEQVQQLQEVDKKGYVLRIGIDDIKDINERFGIEYGDYILRVLADRMKEAAHPGQTVYRMLGDEFILLDAAGRTAEDAVWIYNGICRAIEAAIEKDHYKAVYTVSGGIVMSEDIKARDYGEMMKISQFALSQAKGNGKNQVYLFAEEDYRKFMRRRDILRAVRQSVAEDFKGFELYFQPIMRSEGGNLFAAETLLRFHMSEQEMVSPVEFIPVLEESGGVGNTVMIQELWDKLKEYGVYIALDDFGTGYSNLQNIGNMTPHIVKLDRSFTIKALQHDYENRLMLCIIQMVHSIGLKICVEGVETKEELDQILTLGPDFIQGFYYGKPCPQEEFFDRFIKD